MLMGARGVHHEKTGNGKDREKMLMGARGVHHEKTGNEKDREKMLMGEREDGEGEQEEG